MPDEVPEQEAFERSRAHRRGVRHASADLEQALSHPAAHGAEQWGAEVAARLDELYRAFSRHTEQSEGPDGLLREIVEVAPRLVSAVERVKQDHADVLTEIRRLGSLAAGLQVDPATRQALRDDGLELLQAIAAHRYRGADLVYEAYSVDLEGGES